MRIGIKFYEKSVKKINNNNLVGVFCRHNIATEWEYPESGVSVVMEEHDVVSLFFYFARIVVIAKWKSYIIRDGEGGMLFHYKENQKKK